MSTLPNVIIRDLAANRPAAASAGRLFFASDTGAVSRDNGTTWDTIITDKVQQGAFNYAADTGSANAYAIALTPAPALVAGSPLVFKAANNNTGASTIAVNGGSAIPIKKNGSTALALGDILAGQIIVCTYDGTNAQMTVGGSGGGGGITPQVGTYASLPGSPATGQTYDCTDTPLRAIYTGSAWQWFFGAFPVTLPPAASGFTLTSFGSTTATFSDTYGTITISIPACGSGEALKYWTKTAPSTPYTVTVGAVLQFPTPAAFVKFGLIFRNSSSGLAEHFRVVFSGGTGDMELSLTEYGNTGAGIANDTGPTANRGNFLGVPIWLRINDDGTTRTYSWSVDGKNFITYGSHSHTLHFTPDQYGIVADSSSAQSMKALIFEFYQN